MQLLVQPHLVCCVVELLKEILVSIDLSYGGGYGVSVVRGDWVEHKQLCEGSLVRLEEVRQCKLGTGKKNQLCVCVCVCVCVRACVCDQRLTCNVMRIMLISCTNSFHGNCLRLGKTHFSNGFKK